MKKILLGLGSMTAVIAPIAAVVSCGDKTKYVTVPAADADGVVHNYLTDTQAAVMKDLLKRVYPTIETGAIKKVEMLKDGYSLDGGSVFEDSDYAIRFIFSKTSTLELGDYNKIMRENGELIFAAYSADGRVTAIVKNPNAPLSQHVITGAPKDMIVAALNANEMKFTVPESTNHAEASTGTSTTQQVVQQEHYNFADEIKQLYEIVGQDGEVESTKGANVFQYWDSKDKGDLTLSLLAIGANNLNFANGVDVQCEVEEKANGKYTAEVTFVKGSDKGHYKFTIVPAGWTAQPVTGQQVAADFDFTADLSKYTEGMESHKSVAELFTILRHGLQEGGDTGNYGTTADLLGITPPNLSSGVSATFEWTHPIVGKVVDKARWFGINLTLHKGDKTATKMFYVYGHNTAH